MQAGQKSTAEALCPIETARAGGDAVARLMAAGLDWLTLSVPATPALFLPVDRRLNVLTSGPVVVRLGGADPTALARACDAYAETYHAVDPFAPRRWAESDRAVVGVGDVGGAEAFERSALGGFLARHGLGAPTVLYLRSGGRIVAAVALLRALGERPLGTADLAVLRRCHPLLERSYAVALRSRATGAPSDPGLLGALTRRELEIARLVAAGASNGEIASALSLTVATVKTHMTSVLSKLGLRSRTELIRCMRAHTDG